MAGEWRRVTLRDLIGIKHGWPFKSEFFSLERCGRPIVVSIGNFQYTGGFRFESTAVKEYSAEYPSEYELRPNDILLVMTCQTAGGEILGIPARVPDDGRTYLHNQRMGLVQTRTRDVDVGFLYWLFLSRGFNQHLVATASGTKILHTAPSRIESYEFNLPPLDEQRAIAHILGTLDDKIELNRRTNETLEAMARALFKSWFVDFDPVRAKAQGQTPPGMDPATAALFPCHFQDSELGEIPRGWTAGSLTEVAELNSESWSAKTAPPTVNYVDLSNTKWGKIESTTHYAWAEAPSRARRVLRPGDSVVGTVRPGNGSYALITDEGLTGSTGFAVLRPKAQDDIAFVYLAATSRQNIESLAHLADGGAYPAVRPDVVSATPVVIADEPVMAAFEKAARPLYLHIAHNDRESRTLSRTRDTLLPRLLSGELSVTQAKQAVEATA